MPDDHTAGVGTGDPDPITEVADNDLAVGRMIDTISHSKFWKDSAVFVLEDDAQNGVDHVDGHRAPLLIASPFAQRGIVDDGYYSQINVVRTIEQILGVATRKTGPRRPSGTPSQARRTTPPTTWRPTRSR